MSKERRETRASLKGVPIKLSAQYDQAHQSYNLNAARDFGALIADNCAVVSWIAQERTVGGISWTGVLQ